MIQNLFPKILFGLLVGDYLLQPRNMAIRKSENSYEGFKYCLFHCILVTFVSMLFLQMYSMSIICLIFFSHYIIDRHSLASKWLRLIKGRDFIDEYFSKYKYRDMHLSFACIVYIITDNTFHLLILYYGIPFLRRLYG